MATSASTYGSSPFNPLARGPPVHGTQPPGGLCRVQGGSQQAPDSVGLTKAMSMVVLQDHYSRVAADPAALSQDVLMSQGAGRGAGDHTQPGPSQGQPSSQALHTSFLNTLPRRLVLELSQTHSQELPPMLCTPDFATPGEQQHFMVEYGEVGEGGGLLGLEDDGSRSPAPSPRRHIKRPRPILDLESDTMSQQSQSQSKSQGAPSMQGKPPMHPNRGLRKRLEPPVLRNPYLQPGEEGGATEYHAPLLGGRAGEPLSFRQHRLFWDFKQEEKLGSGNFSDVYAVVHRMSGKRYALKRSKRPVATISDKNMWLAEIQALAAVEGHPNVVTFYDAWVEPADGGVGEHVFIRLELCGPTLGHGGGGKGGGGAGGGSGHRSREPLREQELLDVLRQMAAALKHIHDLGLAHLDLKPDNIYRSRSQFHPPCTLTTAASTTSTSSSLPPPGSQVESPGARGSGGLPPPPASVYKLGDFGLACSRTAAAPVTEGDARYLAPELLTGRCEAGLDRADMFALGATLYELATGSPLPTGGDRYHALRSGQLMMMPCVSMRLQQLIKKLMAPDPRDRPTAEHVLRSTLLNSGGTGSGAVAARQHHHHAAGHGASSGAQASQ